MYITNGSSSKVRASLSITKKDPFALKDKPKYKDLPEDVVELAEAYEAVLEHLFDKYNMYHTLNVYLDTMEPTSSIHPWDQDDLSVLKEIARLCYRCYLRREHMKLEDRIRGAIALLEKNNYVVISPEESFSVISSDKELVS